MSNDEIVSLAPSRLASKGFKFIFEGVSETCRRCRLRSACVDGLEEKRVYEIVDINWKKKFSCPLHGEVVVVTLRKAHLTVALPPGLIEGVIIQYKPIECEDILCKNFPYCNPEGIKQGDKIKIIREIGPLREGCDKVRDYRLYEVEVK